MYIHTPRTLKHHDEQVWGNCNVVQSGTIVLLCNWFIMKSTTHRLDKLRLVSWRNRSLHSIVYTIHCIMYGVQCTLYSALDITLRHIVVTSENLYGRAINPLTWLYNLLWPTTPAHWVIIFHCYLICYFLQLNYITT